MFTTMSCWMFHPQFFIHLDLKLRLVNWWPGCQSCEVCVIGGLSTADQPREAILSTILNTSLSLSLSQLSCLPTGSLKFDIVWLSSKDKTMSSKVMSLYDVEIRWGTNGINLGFSEVFSLLILVRVTNWHGPGSLWQSDILVEPGLARNQFGFKFSLVGFQFLQETEGGERKDRFETNGERRTMLWCSALCSLLSPGVMTVKFVDNDNTGLPGPGTRVLLADYKGMVSFSALTG